MKWSTKRLEYGNKRERIIFAWFPIRCDDGMTRWLERVRVKEFYSNEGPLEFDKWRRMGAAKP